MFYINSWWKLLQLSGSVMEACTAKKIRDLELNVSAEWDSNTAPSYVF